MMRRLTYILCLLLFSVVSCVKQDGVTEDYITFFPYVQNSDQGSTKAIVPDESYILSNKLSVVVNDVAVASVFNNTTIECSDNGLWISDKRWNQNQEYQFYGYIASKGTGTGAALDVSDRGRVVTLTQPTVYSNDSRAWSDYLLSYIVSPNAKYTPIVGLQFERITSAIEVYISKAREDKVVLTNLTLSDVANQMTYRILDHKLEDRTAIGYRNIWNQVAGTNKVDYDRSESIELTRFLQGDDRFDQKFLLMRVLTVPQDLSGTLSLSYTVVENGVQNEYTAEYDLSRLSVNRVAIGHKIRYYIKIDTSVEVETVVAPWKEVDMVEGTFLPN